MEPINFGYSMKNIPTPSNDRYKYKLIEKVEQVIKRMRWKAIYFKDGKNVNNSNNDDEIMDTTFKFKSRNCPSQVEERKEFEFDLLKMIENIEFRQTNNEFQNILMQDLKKIKETPEAYISADKTNNFYKMSKDEYNKVLVENVTKTYKKSSKEFPKSINREAKKLAKDNGLEDKLDIMAKQQCFLTIKDHKEDFRTNPRYRLINPTKSELGQISKLIIENINKELRPIIQVNQWQDTSSAINWFKNITSKEACSFIMFDIQDFYPSITEKLLRDAIDFAGRYVNISPKDKKIIFHARKSLLYHNGTPWVKRGGSGVFDVTMGSYDGTEVCDLVGLYLLSIIGPKFNENNDIGLYRDDGLGISRGLSG